MKHTHPNPPTNTTKRGRRGRKSVEELGRVISVRHEEILGHLNQGRKYSEIAHLLFISIETVRTHAHMIYKRLHVKNKKEACKKFFGGNDSKPGLERNI